MFFMRAALFVAILLSAALARAQGGGEPRWLFVPVVVGELPSRTPPSALSAPWEAAMRGEGERVLSNDSAGSLVEARHSSEPIRVDGQRLEELGRLVDEGQKHLSRAAREKAQQALQAVTPAEREYLRRDPKLEQKLFDVCMMTAALLLREKQVVEAETQVNGCADGFPGYFPPKRKGPPPVQELIARVQRQREQGPRGTLTVTSDPPGCAVRLNGGAVGTTPATLASVGVGIAHVQIECDPKTPGRTHAINIRVGPNQLDVDGVLEAALHTRDALWLSFPDDDVRRRRMRSAGAQLGQLLDDPRTVLLVVEGQGEDIVVQPIPLYSQAPTSGLKPVRWSAGGVDTAALRADILALRSALPPAPKPTPTVTPQLMSDPIAATPERVSAVQIETRTTPVVTQRDWPGVVAGATATTLGVGAFAVSWVVYTQRQTLRRELRPEVDPALRDDFDARGPWVPGAGVVGALSLAFAMPFLLPKASHVPSWAWVIGGLGVAVVGTGIGYSIFERHCAPAAGVTESGCRRFTADGTFGPLLALHGLPMLAVPGTYLIRDWMRPSRGIQLGVEGGVVSLRGSF